MSVQPASPRPASPRCATCGYRAGSQNCRTQHRPAEGTRVIDDMYQRPSREEIAARVTREQPPAPPAPAPPAAGPLPAAHHREPGEAAANLALHLTARMRALGWDTAALAARAGLAQVTAARATRGTPVGLDVAERLATAVTGSLADMIRPYTCRTCAGKPPAGFTCMECGTGTRAG